MNTIGDLKSKSQDESRTSVIILLAFYHVESFNIIVG